MKISKLRLRSGKFSMYYEYFETKKQMFGMR